MLDGSLGQSTLYGRPLVGSFPRSADDRVELINGRFERFFMLLNQAADLADHVRVPGRDVEPFRRIDPQVVDQWRIVSLPLPRAITRLALEMGLKRTEAGGK
jgi:hypothetical protein